MAYYLKKTTLKGRTYLSIDESFYSPTKKGTAHRCFKSLGSVETLKANGMEDPVSYYQSEVDKLNDERNESKQELIGMSPMRFLGYFPLKSILNKLEIKKYIDLFKLTTNFSFDLYDVLTKLIFARAVCPCSKFRTFHEVLPYLFEKTDFSYDQLLDALAYYGNDYEKFVAMFTEQVNKYYKTDSSTTYFDCTNFYFEIDREDDWRRKGPSKEFRRDPILGLGLLLDNNQIPIGMKIYPGNESEKPVMHNVIDEMKTEQNIEGRTIVVADKGLNCAENIFQAKKNGDGYIFSKSVKKLPEIEKEWVTNNNGWVEVREDGELKFKYKSCVDVFSYDFVDEDGKKKRLKLTEKRLVTYNPSLAAKKRYEINKLVDKAKSLSFSGVKKSEYGECSKYVDFKALNKGEITDEAVVAIINNDKIDEDLRLAGYNMIVTSETKMDDLKIYNTYHNLWRIEESFKIMKTDLDARPVFCQLEETIKGHFLICYLTVLLERLFQFKILHDRYSASEIFEFFKEYKVVKADPKYINVTSKSKLITDLTALTGLPLNCYALTEKQIEMILKYSF